MSKIIATDYQDMYGETIHVGDTIRNQRDGKSYTVISTREARTADGFPILLPKAHTQRDFLITQSAELAKPEEPAEPKPELADPGIPRFNFTSASKEEAPVRRGRPKGGVKTPFDPDDPIYRGTKVCKTCWRELPRSAFYRLPSATDGLRYSCIYCQSKSAKEYYRRNYAKN